MKDHRDRDLMTSGTPSTSSRPGSKASTSKAPVTIPIHEQFNVLIKKHEIPRKFLHVSIGFLTLWLYTIGVQLKQVTPVLATLFVGIGTADTIRLNNEAFNRLYCKCCGFLMREKEVQKVNGVIWYLLGLVIVFLIFPKDVSLLAVLLLSWADTAASTFGRAYGYLTPKIGSKSLAGSLSAFVIGCASCWALYGYFIPQYDQFNRPGDIMWNEATSKINLTALVFIAGIVGAVSEAIDFFDDNLTIPVLSSCLMWLIITLGQR